MVAAFCLRGRITQTIWHAPGGGTLRCPGRRWQTVMEQFPQPFPQADFLSEPLRCRKSWVEGQTFLCFEMPVGVSYPEDGSLNLWMCRKGGRSPNTVLSCWGRRWVGRCGHSSQEFFRQWWSFHSCPSHLPRTHVPQVLHLLHPWHLCGESVLNLRFQERRQFKLAGDERK